MKTKKRESVSDAQAQRLNIKIDAEAYRRLMVHCLMAGTTPGRLVQQLVEAHCRAWRVQAIAPGRTGQAQPVPDGEMIGEPLPAA